MSSRSVAKEFCVSRHHNVTLATEALPSFDCVHEPSLLSPRLLGGAHPKAMAAIAVDSKPSSALETVDAIAASKEAARAAGLRYITDRRPGLHRAKTVTGFRYTDSDGQPVHDEEVLARIKSLVIPPAWTDVWIAPLANAHLQATGRDVRGRKQSRYHPKWRETRDETKYERMTHFAAALPRIRERVAVHLALPGLPKEKVLATIVSVMEATHIRVGNVEYARENKSYGLTTMRNKHVDVHGADVTFSFQGKSGVKHTIDLHDRRLAKIIKRCEDLPGYELFQYLDADGTTHSVDSQDVNDYLQEISGEHFTAKDFRTWAGSVLACDMLREIGPYENATQAKKNVVQAIAAVAQKLGNTPSVCRKCYVHPAVLEAYLTGTHVDAATAKAASREAGEEKAVGKKITQELKAQLDEKIAAHTNTLRDEEQALMDLLGQRLQLEKK